MLMKMMLVGAAAAGVATLVWLLIQSEIKRGELAAALDKAELSIEDLNALAVDHEVRRVRLSDDIAARTERLEGAVALTDDEIWLCLNTPMPDVLVDGVLHPDSL